MFSFKKVLIAQVSLLLIAFGLSSCELFDRDVPAYILEYTDEAQIVKTVWDKEYPKDENGVLNIPGGQDVDVTFYLINPQHYSVNLETEWKEDVCEIAAANYEADGTPVQNGTLRKTISYLPNDDKLIYTMKFNGDYLNSIDVKNDQSRRLSYDVIITEPVTGRRFKPVPVKCIVNSAPPMVTDAVVMCDKPNGDRKFVLCFNIPGTDYTASGKPHNDISKLIIDGQEFDVSFAADGSVTINDLLGKVKTTSEAAGLSVTSTNIQFEHTDDGDKRSVYYFAPDGPTGATRTFTITLKDMNGLSSTFRVSDSSRKLGSIGVYKDSTAAAVDKIAPGGPREVGQNADGTCQVFVKVPDVSIQYVDDPENPGNLIESVAGPVSGASVDYTVYKKNGAGYEFYKKGTLSSSGYISVPLAGAKITAQAHRDYYVSSDEHTVEIKPVVNTVFVDNVSGDDENAGFKSSPVKTIDKALTLLTDKTDASKQNKIYLLSNYTGMLSIQGAEKFTLEGYGTTRTMSCPGGVILILFNVQLTLRNLNLTNSLAGIYAAMNSIVTTENVKICGNDGNGINYEATSSQLHLGNGTEISGNKNSGIKDDGNNHSSSGIFVKGKVVVYDNINEAGETSNIVLLATKTGDIVESQLITLEGPLASESKLGVTLYDYLGVVDYVIPSPGYPAIVTKDYDTYAHGINPRTIFVSDRASDFGISKELDAGLKEVRAVIGGAEIVSRQPLMHFELASYDSVTNGIYTITHAPALPLVFRPVIDKDFDNSTITNVTATVKQGDDEVQVPVVKDGNNYKIIFNYPPDVYQITISYNFGGSTLTDIFTFNIAGVIDVSVADILKTVYELPKNSPAQPHVLKLASDSVVDLNNIFTGTFFSNASGKNIFLDLSEVQIADTAVNQDTNRIYLVGCKFPEGMTKLNAGFFNGATMLYEITLPDTLEVIGGSAFSGCRNLKNIVIPPHVKEIGGYAFNQCNALTTVVIPDSVDVIKKQNFRDATYLKLPENSTWGVYDDNGQLKLTYTWEDLSDPAEAARKMLSLNTQGAGYDWKRIR
ncbi:MAG: leucine-rich repeat domain-containing protein [Treponema sp.]|nr:leucine-rich repeat domain-containing protein [Treponema sp.]